jgi:hypothetical protein
LNIMQIGGRKDMAGGGAGIGALKFTPIIKGSDALHRKIRIGRFSPLKLALSLQDLLVACLSFFGTAWLAGLGPVLSDDLSEGTAALVLASLVLGFFPASHLYSYHHIFLKKKHAALLLKAFAWSTLTFGAVPFTYAYPEVMGGARVIPFLSVAGVSIFILS